MTVSELIAKLSDYPQDMEVIVLNDDGQVNGPAAVVRCTTDQDRADALLGDTALDASEYPIQDEEQGDLVCVY